MTADQLMPCLGCDDLRCNDCFESKCRELGYTRPTAVASHAEGEAVAWMVTRDHDPTFPRTYSEKERAVACAASVTLPPFAKIVDLYTHPPRYGDEVIKAVRELANTFRRVEPNVIEKQAVVYRYAAYQIDKTIDAAMAARGGEKAA